MENAGTDLWAAAHVKRKRREKYLYKTWTIFLRLALDTLHFLASELVELHEMNSQEAKVDLPDCTEFINKVRDSDFYYVHYEDDTHGDDH